MSEIILHHYPTSPFSEKVRLILGYKDIPWQSVHIPQIMPKPDAVALTGGYRRTPFMQIGADIYCDTALICQEIERRYPSPSLYPAASRDAPAALVDTVAQWADTTLFWSGAIGYAFQGKGLAYIFKGVPPDIAKAFGADRAAMRAGAPRVPSADSAGALRVFLERIDGMMSEHPFLLTATPSLADFATYHPLWFVRRIEPLADILNVAPRILPWMDRIAALGHGRHTPLASTDAIALARASTPDPRPREWNDVHGLQPGARVVVTPLDYAFDPVAGELVISDRDELAVRRTDERAGTVVVHFPRVGYKLERAPE